MSLQYCRDHGRGRLTRFLRKITIDMSYTFRHWRRHQRATRHLQLWTPRCRVQKGHGMPWLWPPRKIITSDNIRRLVFPDLAFIGTATCALRC